MLVTAADASRLAPEGHATHMSKAGHVNSRAMLRPCLCIGQVKLAIVLCCSSGPLVVTQKGTSSLPSSIINYRQDTSLSVMDNDPWLEDKNKTTWKRRSLKPVTKRKTPLQSPKLFKSMLFANTLDRRWGLGSETLDIFWIHEGHLQTVRFPFPNGLCMI